MEIKERKARGRAISLAMQDNGRRQAVHENKKRKAERNRRKAEMRNIRKGDW
jgi:hypothetical protein